MKPRLLVIDDERLLGQTIRLGLSDAFEIELETSGREGLRRLMDGEEFEAVLCDLSMPDVSGMEIHSQMMRSRPELGARFIVMTGGAMTEDSRVFLEGYQGLLLAKPFGLKQVEELVSQLLA